MHALSKYKKEAGIGIVEVIAALGLSVVVLTALVSLSIFSLRSSLHSKLQLEGTKIANREMELIRAYRDGILDWQNGTDGFIDQVLGCTDANDSSRCHMNFSGGLSVGNGVLVEGAGAEAITRYFYVTNTSGGALQSTDQAVRINVVVRWVVGDDVKYARLYTDLTNWANK